MSSQVNFVNLALDGKVMMDEIDDFVDLWHNTPLGELHDFLGMSTEEYSLWLVSPDAIGIILASRKAKTSLRDFANDNLGLMRLAARTDDMLKVQRIQRWLDKRNKQ